MGGANSHEEPSDGARCRGTCALSLEGKEWEHSHPQSSLFGEVALGNVNFPHTWGPTAVIMAECSSMDLEKGLRQKSTETLAHACR